MPITAAFTGHEIDFASRKAIFVNELAIAAISNLALAGLHGGGHVLVAGNFVVRFDFQVSPYNGAMLELKTAGGTPCYFLPYKADCGISMALAGGADYFFTSSLSGCTVQVTGPQNAPTVTHANAYTTFQNNKAHGEAAASLAAQGVINTLLPAPIGALIGTVTKADYLGKVTPVNMAAAKNRHTLKKAHHRMGAFNAYMDEGGQEKVGAFVFGIRSGGNWSFYYQATVAVTGTRHTGLLWGRKTKAFLPEDAVVGMPEQFYP
jgi:hypothetical protein